MAKLFHSYITGYWRSRQAACEMNVLHWMCCNNFVPLRYQGVLLLALSRCWKYHEWCFVAQRLSWNLSLIPPPCARLKAGH